jgi:hypothetical protein
MDTSGSHKTQRLQPFALLVHATGSLAKPIHILNRIHDLRSVAHEPLC